MRTVFRENIRHLYFSGLGNKIRVKSWSLCIQMYGDEFRYNLLVALVIMLLLLMMQLEKLGFIALDKKYDVLATFKKWKALVENET